MTVPLKLTNRDFYNNPVEPQQPTPTTILLSKRNQNKVESPNWKGYTLTEEHLTPQQLQGIITGQVNVFLKGEPESKRFALTLTLEEETI